MAVYLWDRYTVVQGVVYGPPENIYWDYDDFDNPQTVWNDANRYVSSTQIEDSEQRGYFLLKNYSSRIFSKTPSISAGKYFSFVSSRYIENYERGSDLLLREGYAFYAYSSARNTNAGFSISVGELTVGDTKGELIDTIIDTNRYAYPTDGIQNGYYYVYIGEQKPKITVLYTSSNVFVNQRTSVRVDVDDTELPGTTDITIHYEVSVGSGSFTEFDTVTCKLSSVGYGKRGYYTITSSSPIRFRAYVTADGYSQSDYEYSDTITPKVNVAPTTPSSITYPSSIKAGTAFTISWGASTDSNDNLAGYQLYRSLNGGTYKSIYTGSSTSYQDIVPIGTSSVRYRVRAYDSYNLYSGYRTGTVVNLNDAPVISGSNQNLGVFTYNPPVISYVITDENNDTVAVTIQLDSSTLESRTVTLGQTYTVPINWWDINTGSHTVTITANDGQGGTATRTYTFTKNSVGQISFNRLHKKTDTGYQTTYIETDSDSIITNNGQILSERLESIATKLSVSINTTPTEMVSRHRLHIKLTSEYTIDYLEMYSTNVKVGSSTLESILTQLESKVGISNSGTVPSNLNFERWRMKNSSGEYDIIYLEGVSEHIVCPCGKTVEERLVAIEAKL